MPRRKVPIVPGEFYHVYNRGVNRELVFFERENYLFLLQKFREFVFRESTPAVPSSRGADTRPVEVVAYCLMPNHYHFCIRVHCVDFSRRMQSFSQSYSNAINKRHSRVGPLFQARFQAVHVDQEEYLLHLTRYIHLNPVEAMLVRRPADWEFSSYLEYIGLRQGSLPSPDIVLREFGSREDYRHFVESQETSAPPGVTALFIDD